MTDTNSKESAEADNILQLGISSIVSNIVDGYTHPLTAKIDLLKLFKEYASQSNSEVWTDEKIKRLLEWQINECAVFFDRCARDKGASSKEYDEWIKSTPLVINSGVSNSEVDGWAEKLCNELKRIYDEYSDEWAVNDQNILGNLIHDYQVRNIP